MCYLREDEAVVCPKHIDLIADRLKEGNMTEETLAQLDEAHMETHVARKQMEEAIENYILARQLHAEALRVHNETD